jgi:branched-chain amino acid transport system permease protein
MGVLPYSIRSPGVPTSHRAQLRVLPTRPARIAVAAVAIALAVWWVPAVFETSAPLGVGLDDLNFALIAVVGAVSLNLLAGYGGLLSMGHAAFLALGALAGGAVGVKLGAPFWVTLAASAVLGAGVGAVVGLPALRLRGLYLLLSTLALHFIGLYLFLQYQLKAFGPAGIVFDAPSLGPVTFDDDRKWYLLSLVAAVVSVWLVRNLTRTREGRALIAVRHSDVAAGAAGVNVGAVKLKAFALSSAIVSASGTLYAYYLALGSHGTYTLAMVEGFYAMVIIGGMGSLGGPVVGALLYSCVPAVLSHFSDGVSPTTPVLGTFLSDHSDQISQLLFGVLIIVILVVRPAGLVSMWQSIKESVARWPYSTR